MQKTSHPMEPVEMMAYLDGELPVDRAAAAAAHLERCAECQALAADLRAVSQSLLAWEVESSQAMPPAAPPPEPAHRPLWRMPAWGWGLASVAVVVLAFSLQLGRRRPAAMSMAFSNSIDGQPAMDQAQAPAAPAPPAQAPPAAPMVARTAALNLAADRFDAVRPAVDATIARHNGYLASLNVSAPAGGARSLNAVLRIPAADLESAMAELKTLGRVESEEQSGEEVGEQFRDLEARLSNARATEQRLTDILRDRTGKLSDVLDVERELDRVRGEIERMEAERKGLAKRVDYATLNLTVSEIYAARPAARFGDAAAAGWRTMIDGTVAVGLFLVSVAPTVLLWAALLFFPVRYFWRRRRRNQ